MSRPQPGPFSFQDAVALLVSRGLDEDTIRLASIAEKSLSHARAAVSRHCPQGPLRALHVGNFVGVSLAALSDIVVGHDPGSVVVSVDPNLSHLGVDDPQQHVLALLDRFGLQRNNVVICGYSLHRVANKTAVGTFADQPAGEGTLASLDRLGQRFDVAMIDGNHDQDYVRRELELLTRLLSDRALLILDDVHNEHTEIPELFDEVVNDEYWPFEQVDRDARVGILRKVADAQKSGGEARERG